MKKILCWISIRLICVSALLSIAYNSSTQVLWGMSSDGGGKKTGGNIFSINGDGTGYTERYPFFNDGSANGAQRLLNYGDGYLYGVADNILFRHLLDGTGYEVVYVFQQATGYVAKSRLLKGLDNFLYGTTLQGGNSGYGVIYKVNTNGTSYQVLHHFNGTNGKTPNGNLLQITGGPLCGTTEKGGSSDKGTIYRINPDGTGFQSLHSFNGTNGEQPAGGLITVVVSSTTYVYGLTSKGGSYGFGVIFRIEPSGTNFSRQYNFSTNSGKYPVGSLIRMGGNLLCGVTRLGGINDGGVVFAYDADVDTYQKLHQFNYDPINGVEYEPTGPLLNVNGVLYGTTELGGNLNMGVLYKLNTDGTGYQVLHDFDDRVTYVGNLLYVNGQIYGLTGGDNSSPDYSNGTVFRLNTNGTGFQTIHRFSDDNGYGPVGSLTIGQDGKLYGLTPRGGGESLMGLAFSIETTGSNYNPLIGVGPGPGTGQPKGSLIQATNGSFYGMNNQGGVSYSGQVFKLTVSGTPSVQYYNPFCPAPGCAQSPVASLIQANDGKLYGMTQNSGYQTGVGNIFRIDLDGTGYTILTQFNGTNGANPAGSLIQAPDGYLYGMTENGGALNFGTIFKVNTNGTGFQTIFHFGTYASAYYGSRPKGRLLLGSDGKLYGMASAGGTFGGGTLFQINIDGTGISRLIDFNSVNGWVPVASLVEDVNSGFLFGMTEQGGTSNFGVVFKIKKDGTGYQTLLNFNGTNGKYPKGDLLIVQPGTPLPQRNPITALSENSISKKSPTITIFPNPVRQTFTIRFQKPLSGRMVYSIKDLSGRKLMEKTIDQTAIAEIKSVDISSLPSGTYLLELATPKGKFTQKIVKQ